MISQKFCSLPWNGFEINADGTARPCCFFNERISKDGVEFNVVDTPINTIRNSDYMKTLRQEFIDGKEPVACNQCWAEEKAGRASNRTKLLLRYPKQDIQYANSAAPLEYLGVALGNICNLKCRICGPWASSSWNADELKQFPKNRNMDTLEGRMLALGSWPIDSKTFWDDFNNEISSLKELRIYGGEPFMIPAHFKTLKFLVEKNIAKNISLMYNTNGTKYPDEAEELWKHFKSIDISFSIDNLGSKFEYERKNARWDLVEANIARFQELSNKYSNIQLQCVVTVSVFNILDLEQIAHWIQQKNFKIPTFWNVLHFAEYNCIQNLSAKHKEIIKNQLENISVSSVNLASIQQIINFMLGDGKDLEDQLLKEIYTIDKFRNENLADSHPELAELLGYAKKT